MAKKRAPAKRIIEVFAKNKGNLTKTATALGVTRQALWLWQQEDQELAKQMHHIKQARYDGIEEAVEFCAEGIPKMEWVEVTDKHGTVIDKEWKQTGWLVAPNIAACALILAARARERGYGKQEIELGAAEGTEILITNTIVKRGSVIFNQDGKAEIVED